MKHWSYNSVFYHIYPVGFCGAPLNNDFSFTPVPRLNKIREWIEHFKNLGINALYLGPLFESSVHGYDTADYYNIDRRLGDNKTMSELVDSLHNEGIRVILDGVFHHVGRDFWAFRDVMRNGEASPFCTWFSGLHFGNRSPYNDPFTYEGWNGHYNLVKLNLYNEDVKNHIYNAVKLWIDEFHIDGLRLDVAEAIDINFLKELADFTKSIKSDFWLMGEAIHGDYRRLTNGNTLDSVTNYEIYKGLYSSHNDKNYFEIAYSLNRQFGEEYGLYKNLPLYNFADNHDVDRVASILKNSAHLYTLYSILFTIPGVPSIYYGSEWGIGGKKTNEDDNILRPDINLQEMLQNGNMELLRTIKKLASIRLGSQALCHGTYKQLSLNHEQFSFLRQSDDETVVVAINASDKTAFFDIPINWGYQMIDLMNSGEVFEINSGKAKFEIHPYGTRIMTVK